jgi:hypothetical protein
MSDPQAEHLRRRLAELPEQLRRDRDSATRHVSNAVAVAGASLAWLHPKVVNDHKVGEPKLVLLRRVTTDRPWSLSLCRLAGHPTLAAALPHAGRDPTPPLAISAWHTDERTLPHFDGALRPD